MAEAPSALDQLRQETQALAAILEEGGGGGGDTIDLGRLKRQKAALGALKELLRGASTIVTEISELGKAADARVRAELGELQRRLAEVEGARPKPEPEPGAGAGAGASGAGASRPPAPPGIPVLPSAVTVGGGLTLSARVLPPGVRKEAEVKAATAGGGLVFVSAWNQFAFSFGGIFFHANVGEVYYGRPGPDDIAVRLWPCTRESCGRGKGPDPKCAFYHDPASHPGSSDTRNFLATSWVYGEHKDKGRKFGSRPYLAADIREMTRGGVDLFKAQVAHDILCLLLLERYVA